MSFADQLARFAQKKGQHFVALRDGTDSEMFRSVVNGSEITGAPGQPVRHGKLRDSWKQETDGSETVTSTDVPYARAVEENWGDVVYASGGPHSVALTAAGFERIVGAVVQRVAK